MTHTVEQKLRPGVVRLYHLQIAAILLLQLPDLHPWIALFALAAGLIATAHRLAGVRLPSPWIIPLLYGSFTVMIVSVYQAVNLTSITAFLSLTVAMDLLSPLTVRRCHQSALKVLALLGFSLIGSDSFWLPLLVLVFLISIINILFLCNQPHEGTPLRQHFSGLMRISLQTLLIVAALFILVPGLVGYKHKSRGGQTGFSDRLNPGSIAGLSRSNHIAFTARPLTGELPPQSYWRGSVLSRSEGLRWRQSGEAGEAPVMTGKGSPQVFAIRQEAGTGPVLFGRPPVAGMRSSGAGRILGRPGGTYRLHRPPGRQFTYESLSFTGGGFAATDPPLSEHLQLPGGLSPEVRYLAHQLRGRSRDQRDYAARLMQWFVQQRFQYTLNPGRIEPPTIAGFLRHKKGFCEHYAATFATMLRLAGVPSRVVVGFHGGEANPFTGAVTVKGYDAHAWVEAWFDGAAGWSMLDPTTMLAPQRLALGGQRYHSTLERRLQAWLPLPLKNFLWQGQMRLMAAADALELFLTRLGDLIWTVYETLLGSRPLQYLAVLTLCAPVALAVVRWFRRRPAGARRLLNRYIRRCRLPRLPHETEWVWFERLMTEKSDPDGSHRAFMKTCLALRYGPYRSADLRRASRALRRLKPLP